MGKRRKTAKTGDKAIYKAALTSNKLENATEYDMDDHMYGKVDRLRSPIRLVDTEGTTFFSKINSK